MREIDAGHITVPDLSRVGETLRAAARGLRGFGSETELPSFASALAAATGESEAGASQNAGASGSQNAGPSGSQPTTGAPSYGGRLRGEPQTADSRSMAKPSRDRALGDAVRTPLTPQNTSAQPARTPAPPTFASIATGRPAQQPTSPMTPPAPRPVKTPPAAMPAVTPPIAAATAPATSATRTTPPASLIVTPPAPSATDWSRTDPVSEAGIAAAGAPPTVATAASAPPPALTTVAQPPSTSGTTASGKPADPLALKAYAKPAYDLSSLLNWSSTATPSDNVGSGTRESSRG